MEYLGHKKAINKIVPIVSVCIQVYNNEDYIENCIENVLNQKTNFPLEIIIGEDDSTDKTRKICKQLAKQNQEKIRLFLRSEDDKIYHNGRKTSRFNFISNIKAARGKYIALCDGDDYWCDNNKLQMQFDVLENKTDYVACHHWQRNAIYKDFRWVEVESPTSLGFGFQDKIKGTVCDIFKNNLRIKARTVMFRNIVNDNFLPNWFEQVSFADVSLSFLLGRYGDFYFINKEMAVYRQSPDGLSKSGLKELGYNNFKVEHFKNYIEIWDYADKHYNYRYHKESISTVNLFYKNIFYHLPTSFSSLINLIFYNLFKRRLSFLRTLPSTNAIVLLFIKKISKKIKRKLNGLVR